MKRELVSILSFFCFAVSSAQDNNTNPEVVTQHGTIIGQVVPTPLGVNAEVFKGIPYAVPPIGSRRFLNPEFYGEFPGGIWNADDYRDVCVQDYLPIFPSMSEDCLYLNIWRPEVFKPNRAVMVFIPGGGFGSGAGSQYHYNGKVFSVYGDVIFVSINYRLGVFGFLHTGDDRVANGNQGLLDQVMALQWVYENIEAFGGDPQQVTIFGVSAGGASVNHLLLMPDIEHLFNRAIMQSGDSTAYWAAQSMVTVAAAYQWVSEQTGCPNDDTFLDCLRDIPALDLHNMTVADPGRPLYNGYAPTVDGVTIIDAPLRMMQSGQMHKKDVFLGINKDEGSWFIYNFPEVNPINVVTDPNGTYSIVAEERYGILRNLTEDELAAVLEAYAPLDENGPNKAKISISDMIGDVAFVCPLQQTARAFDQHGMKVYQYYLTHRASKSPHPEWQGVRHFDEVQWIFGTPLFEGTGYEPDEEILSMEVMDKWTNFAKYGYPDITWPTYSSAGGAAYTEIRGPSDFVSVTGDDVRGEFCQLWNFE